MPKALITGITGQDGSYLTELLLSLGYEVHGLIRRASTFNTGRLDHLYTDPHRHMDKVSLNLHYGDVTVPETITDMIYNIRPDEIYNLAAQSHVRVSFDMPEYTGEVTGLGTTRMLEAIRKSGIKCRFYPAAGADWRIYRSGCYPCARRHSYRQAGHPLLPGILQRNVRRGQTSSNGEHRV
jgi:GDPmannose 4,6-dehydratase